MTAFVAAVPEFAKKLRKKFESILYIFSLPLSHSPFRVCLNTS
jgi:hypothetical protein